MTQKTPKILLCIVFVFLFSCSWTLNSTQGCTGGISTPLAPGANYYVAQWKESNSQPYLQIVASNYYQLGVAQATFLGEDILYGHYMVIGTFEALNISLDMISGYIPAYLETIPTDYISMMQGIAAVLPLSIEDLILQTILLDIYYGQLVPMMSGYPQPPLPEIGGCTAIGARNGRFGEIVGQTFDFPVAFGEYTNFVKYWVRGKLPVFTIQLGFSPLAEGKNPFVRCISTVIQTIVVGEIQTPYTIRTRIALENCYSLDALEDAIIGFASPWNYILADSMGLVRGYETIPSTYVAEEVNTWCVRTNTYENPAFRPYLVSQTYSMARQQKAEELVQDAYVDKRLSAEEALAILSYRDALDPEKNICRYAGDLPTDPVAYDTQTLGFIIFEDNGGYFGLGTPRDNPAGMIPALSPRSFFA